MTGMEIWDLYDERGQKTGETWERSRAREIPEGRYHIVCDILIRHQDGEFLLTLRDPEKDVYPGCLEASAGGSALSGETPEEAARREQEKREKEEAKKQKQKFSKRSSSPLGRVANSAMNSIGREVGRSIGRGLLGTLKKWF